MWDLIISNAISGTLVLSGAIWYFKKYLNSYVDHEFNKRTEVYKAELQAKQQEHQHFHEILKQALSDENKELKMRKITAIDSLWKSLLEMKKFSIAVKFLSTLNFDELQKRANDPKMKKFYDSFPLCSFEGLQKELEATKSNPAELSRPWVSHRAWSLYLAYITIIYYAICQFENAKVGGTLGNIYDESKMLEILQNALPDVEIKNIFPTVLLQMHDLIEFTLLLELKSNLATKEDAAAIARAKTIFEIASDIKSSIKLKDIN